VLGAIGIALRVRLPRELPPARPASRRPVSVVVPARNEARNIVAVLESLAAQRYTDFEILIVDDRSEDGTADLARAVDPANASRIAVIEGVELPADWFGKPWACHQGAERATGELLLFTDADTVHGPDLLSRAIAAMDEDEAGVVTVVGRQIMGSFWERLVQPHIFMGMVLRFADLRRPRPAERWRGAIANGQYMLFRREALDAIGGFASVRRQVVEDLKLAQRLVRLGHVLTVRRAEDAFATRMYRSLREIVDGWSKNLVLGGMASLPPGPLRPLVPAVTVAVGVMVWIAPPATLGVALLGFGGRGVLVWAAATTVVSATFWVVVTHRMRAPAPYGLLYPLGAAVAFWIVLRAWRRGTEVEWKGRRYDVAHPSEDDAEAGDP
jgi:chlorobactene glucosyltransferase